MMTSNATRTLCVNASLRIVTCTCFVFMWIWILVGGTTSGKKWYASQISHLTNDPKGGLPLVVLSLPIILASSLIMLFALREPETGTADGSGNNRTRRYPTFLVPFFAFLSWLQQSWMVRRLVRSTNNGCCCCSHQSGSGFFGSSSNRDRQAMVMFVIPITVYTVACIYRHLEGGGDDMSQDDKLMEIGNSFGMGAVVALALLLVPVTKHNAIARVFRLCRTSILQYHIWIGRIVIITSLVHGGFHIYRFWLLTSPAGGSGNNFWSLFIPPASCYTAPNDTIPGCSPSDNDSDEDIRTRFLHEGEDHDHHDEDEDNDSATIDCSCYHRGRNFTGVVAGIGLLIIAISTLPWIRRKFYAVFYNIHVMVAPLVFVTIIMHYNKTILYIAGSLLFYLASNAPIWIETWWKKWNNKNVRIVSVQHIPCSAVSSSNDNIIGDSCCVSLTVSASDIAMRRFRPGQYVNLLAPETSWQSHPFTINTVHNNENQLRIIFRVMKGNSRRGARSYTRQLSERLVSSKSQSPLHLDGYYGPSNRLEQVLSHNAVVFIAGGIGITPYLSLLHHTIEHHQILSSGSARPHNKRKADNNNVVEPMTKKKVILHWICRDAGLIKFIKKEYFDPLHTMSSVCDIRIVIHYTGDTTTTSNDSTAVHKSYSDLRSSSNPQEDDNGNSGGTNNLQVPEGSAPSSATGAPFTPSAFSPVSKTLYRSNMVMLFVPYMSIVLLSVLSIWYLYSNVQDGHQVVSRIYAPIVIIIITFVITITVQVVLSCLRTIPEEDDEAPMKSVMTSDDDTEWTLAKSYDSADEDEVELGPTRPIASAIDAGGKHTKVEDVELAQHQRAIADPLKQQQHSNDDDDGATDAVAVQLEERTGRPTVHQLLQPLLDDTNQAVQSPGLFICGPVPLMNEVRDTIQFRCAAMQYQHTRQQPQGYRIALYEESFEM